MISGRHKKRFGRARLLALMLLPAVFTACTPRQKTLRLPESQEVEVEQENASEGFTVKRIYTYDYETKLAWERSAFLSDCGPHEVKIVTAELSSEEEGVGGNFWKLDCRMVDYRYGFYDSTGNLRLWHSDALGELYPRKIKISPTGREALFYEGSTFWGNMLVWLCDFKTQSTQLLYETAGEEEINRRLFPSWSPSGRWMSFDMMGIKEGSLVGLYDMESGEMDREGDSSETDGTKDKEWEHMMESLGLGGSSFRSVDKYLYNIGESKNLGTDQEIFDQELFDCWEGTAGILNFVRDWSNPEILRVIAMYPPEWEQQEPSWENPQASEFYLHWQMGDILDYLAYQVNWEEQMLYYLIGYERVEQIHMGENTSETVLQASNLEELILDFRRLDDGSFLTIQGEGYFMGNEEVTNEGGGQTMGNGIEKDMENLMLTQVQELLHTEDLSLYWYPQGQQEGQLLYKDLHNLIHMEYDAPSRRILLETWQGETVYDGKRQCMILEL